MIRYIKSYLGINQHRYFIDALKDRFFLKEKDRVTELEKIIFCNSICHEKDSFLNLMGVDPVLKQRVKNNILATENKKNLVRAQQVFNLMLLCGITGKQADEFLCGAHFIVEDKGCFFEVLKKIPGCKKRFSSHFYETRLEEYGLHCGRVIPELLFLNTYDLGDTQKIPKRTHFQTEPAAWRVRQMLDFFKYYHNIEHVWHSFLYLMGKWFGRILGRKAYNIGPYGYSEHHDGNPIYISVGNENHNNDELITCFNTKSRHSNNAIDNNPDKIKNANKNKNKNKNNSNITIAVNTEIAVHDVDLVRDPMNRVNKL
jgi:hypothetical protein